MKKSVLGSTLSVFLLAASIGQSADQERLLQMPRLSADYSKRLGQILPNPSEQSYRKIAWRTSVLCGIADAQKIDRPVMIVLMNGHPLGCT
jgi:hypothetical protein